MSGVIPKGAKYNDGKMEEPLDESLIELKIQHGVKEQKMDCKELVTVAIDIGTAFSGFAFLSRNDFKISPLKVECKVWHLGELGVLTKTKSIILLNNEMKYVAFGYEAEKMYHKMDPEQAKNHYYFSYFKMTLYQSKSLRRKMRLNDGTGRRPLAYKVFSESIRYLKDQALDLLSRSSVYQEGDIQWVITLPAIWSESAKQFMIYCASEAGIEEDKLKVALEPESAAMFCHYLELNRHETGDGVVVDTFRDETKFLVLDLGGGTVDITAYRVNKDSNGRTLQEIYKATGGACGGRKVDEAFEKFWRDVLGSEIWDELKREYRDEIDEFFTRFEILKRSETDRDNIILMLPECIREVEDLHSRLKEHSRTSIQIKRGKITFPRELYLSFFKSSLQELTKIVKDLLSKNELVDLDAVLMVGGYSESRVVQSAIREVIESRDSGINVFIPTDAGSAVLKGACIYGFSPDVITTRVSRYTYGVSTRVPFDETCHSRSSVHFGGNYMEDIFHKFVRAGDLIPLGKIVMHKFNAKPNNNEIELFASTENDPTYTMDPSVDKNETFRIGAIKFPPFRMEDYGRQVEISMIFGDTVFTVSARFSTGEEVQSELTLLK